VTTETAERRRPTAQVWRAVRRALEVTFVEPVEEGRPVPSSWPAGLPTVGWATLGLVVALSTVAAFSSVLRVYSPFVSSTSTDRSMPTLVLPVFILVVVWTLGLAHCAMIRLAWYLKIPALFVAITAMVQVGLFAVTELRLLALTVLPYLVVVVLVLARRRRPYTWWEFPLITSLLAVSWVSPFLLSTSAQLLGVDLRLIQLESSIESFSPLAMPALVAAGVAPAIVTMSAAEAIASRAVPRVVVVLGVLGVVAWRVVTVVRTVLADPVEQGWGAVLASAVVVALAALAIGLMWRLSATRAVTQPGDLPELWTAWSFPMALALVGIAAVVTPLVVVYVLGSALSLPGADVLGAFVQWINSGAGLWWRVVPGIAFVVLAVVLSRRGRTGEASMLAVVSVATLVAPVGSLLPPHLLQARTPEGIAAVTSVLALVVLVVTAAFKELNRRRFVGLFTVMLVGGLYTYRDVLDDPVSAVVGYAGLATALFGLVWQGLTGAGFTRNGSRRLPQETRVLAYLANTLFAFCIVAFVAASRSSSGTLSLVDLDSTGDYALGTPLLLAATVLGLWYGFGARERREDEPSLPPSVPR
jgi:hypothetical protein